MVWYFSHSVFLLSAAGSYGYHPIQVVLLLPHTFTSPHLSSCLFPLGLSSVIDLSALTVSFSLCHLIPSSYFVLSLFLLLSPSLLISNLSLLPWQAFLLLPFLDFLQIPPSPSSFYFSSPCSPPLLLLFLLLLLLLPIPCCHFILVFCNK